MQIRTSIEIERGAREVFAVISDFSRNPEWQEGMVSAEWTSDPPVGVGSTYDQKARFLGRDVITSFEVVAYEPDRSISIESRRSSFPIQVTRVVEPLGPNRCQVIAEVAGQPGGTFKLLAPLAGWMARRSIKKDYQKLRLLLEA